MELTERECALNTLRDADKAGYRSGESTLVVQGQDGAVDVAAAFSRLQSMRT